MILQTIKKIIVVIERKQCLTHFKVFGVIQSQHVHPGRTRKWLHTGRRYDHLHLATEYTVPCLVYVKYTVVTVLSQKGCIAMFINFILSVSFTGKILKLAA